MRILFAFVGGRGHLEPLLPIAAAAAAAGHEVAFAGQAAMAAEVEAESFTAFAAGPPTLRTTKAPLLVPDQAFEDGVVRDHFAGTIARGRAEDLIALGQRWPPDLIVADQMDFGALLAAERLGVPRAIVGVIASGVFGGADLVGDTLNGLRAELGLAADPDMAMLERDLVLLPIPPRFLSPTANMSPTTHFIRPAVLEPAAAPLSPARRDRPLVYVTLGTIFNLESGDLFARAISAVRDLAVDVIVTIGPHLDPLELGAQPANVRIVPFIPQATILPDCDVVVCHGGSGTVIGALCYGVPLVLLAMGADQLHNAERAATLGVAIALDVMTATVDDIGSAVLTLLSDPIYRERARAFREEAAGLPDARHAVGLLEALVERRGRPVRVRTLSPDEWALLREVRLRALTDSPTAFTTSAAEAIVWPDERWQQIAPNRAVAFIDGAAAGLIGWHPSEQAEATIEVVSVWVDPRHRGTGVADALMQHALGACGPSTIELGVVESNRRALRFYERFGFVAYGRVTGTRTGDPIIRMRFAHR